MKNLDNNLTITSVPIDDIKRSEYYVRKQSQEVEDRLTDSFKEFGIVDPIILNNAPDRMNILIGGDFRVRVAKKLGYTEIPAVYVTITDIEKEKELGLRLNHDVGEFDYDLRALTYFEK